MYLLLLLSAHAAPMSLLVDPLIHGRSVDIEVYDAPPGAVVHLLASDVGFGEGSTLPGGEPLQILRGSGYRRILSARADATGALRWTLSSLSPTIQPGDWYLQAVVMAGPQSQASNALYRPVTELPPPYVDDAWEPNDDRAMATRLFGPRTARICPGSHDLYRIDVPSGWSTSVVLRAPDGPHPLRPEMSDLDGLSVGRAFGSHGAWGETWRNVKASTEPLWVSVEHPGAGNRCATYEVDLALSPAIQVCNDPADGSDSRANAAPLTLGTPQEAAWCPGDTDWWSFTTDAGELVLKAEVDGGEAQLELYRGPLRVPLREDGTVDVIAGTYHLRLDGHDDAIADGLRYRLLTELRDPCPTSLGSLGNAYPLTLGSHLLRVCPGPADVSWLELPPLPLGLTQVSMVANDSLEAVLHVPDLLDDPRALSPWQEETWDIQVEGHRSPQLSVHGAGPIQLQVDVDHTPVEPCREDAHEPNNTVIQTTPLRLGVPLAATSCAGDGDYYSLDLQQGERVTLALDWDADATPRSFTVSGVVPLQVAQGTLELQAPQDGPLYVVVSGGLEGGDAYVLRATTGSAQDPHEPNDTSRRPAPITYDTWLSALGGTDEDWYILPPPTSGELRVHTGPCMRVVDGTGQVVLTDCPPFSLAIQTVAYLNVRGGAVTGPYTLYVQDGEDRCVDDVFAPNHTASEAAPILPGRHANALCDGQEDWFTWSSAGALTRVHAESEDGGPPLEVEVTDGSTVLQPLSIEAAGEAGWYATSSSGLTAQVAGGADHRAYTLVVEELTPAPCPADGAEPNNSAATATPLQAVTQGTACPGDLDWWEVDIPRATRFDGMVQTPEGEGVLAVEITDAAGTTVTEAAPADGVYRIRLSAVEDAGPTLGVPYTLIPPTLVCGEDVWESNDSRAQATAVAAPFEETPRTCAADEDWFAIDATVGDTLHIGWEAEHPVIVDVFEGSTPLIPALTATRNTLTLSVAANDVHHVRVRGTPGVADQRYGLAIELDSVCTEDAWEPNNQTSQSTLLPLGTALDATSCPGNRDVFAVSLLPGEVLGITVDAPVGQVRTTVLDAASNFLGDATDRPFVWSPSVAGPVHIQTEWRSTPLIGGVPSRSGVPYAVEAVDVDPCGSDGFEPNDDAALAPLLGPGTWPDLWVCGIRESDWFEVPLAAGETLDATLGFLHDDGDLDLLVVDEQGGLLTWSGGRADVESVRWTATAPGSVWLQVMLWEEHDLVQVGNRYDLDVSVF